MTLDYQKMWDTMNSLEMTSTKICSAREIINCAVKSLESGDWEKTERLMLASYEFLEYYLDEFDAKFKDAWNSTVVASKNTENNYSISSLYQDDIIDFNYDGKSVTDPFMYPEDYYIFENEKTDKVVKWQLPIQVDNITGENFLQLPEDLLHQVNWKGGEELEWIDNKDGSFTLRKVKFDPYENDMIAAGYEMIEDKWVLSK